MPGHRLTIAAALWAALLGLSIALSVLAARHETLPADTAIARWAQGLAFPGQTLSDTVRAISSTELVLAAGALLALALWQRGFRREALLFALGLALLAALEWGIKEAVDRPRPSEAIVDVRGSRTSSSFPSGHTMSGAFLYGSVAYLAVAFPMPAAARAALAGLSIAVLALLGPVNVWLGVHWPSDALGGYAWGLVLLGLVVLAGRRGNRPS